MSRRSLRAGQTRAPALFGVSSAQGWPSQRGVPRSVLRDWTRHSRTIGIHALATQDWTGGQIKNDDSADDVKNVDLTQACEWAGVGSEGALRSEGVMRREGGAGTGPARGMRAHPVIAGALPLGPDCVRERGTGRPAQGTRARACARARSQARAQARTQARTHTSMHASLTSP